MATLKLAPNVAPSMNIGINNAPDPRTVSVANTPDPRGVYVPAPNGGPGTTITNYAGPAHTWSVAPQPVYRVPLFAKPGITLALGARRSLIGTGQSLSGLYDLISPGKGTNRISKSLDAKAKETDQTAKQYGVSGAGYHGAQAAADLLQLLVGGGEAKYLAKGVGETSKAAKFITSTSKTAKLARFAAGDVGATGYYSGQQASKGRDISPTGVAEQLALGAAGLPAAKYAPDAARFIKDVVMPGRAADKFYGAVANHLVNSGAVLHDAEEASAQKAAAGMKALSDAEGEARRVPPPKALPAGNRFTTANPTQVIEASAQLAKRYQAERNGIIRQYAGNLRDPKLKTQLASLEKKYVRKHEAMVRNLESRTPQATVAGDTKTTSGHTVTKADKKAFGNEAHFTVDATQEAISRADAGDIEGARSVVNRMQENPAYQRKKPYTRRVNKVDAYIKRAEKKTGTVKVAGVDTGLRPNATFDEIKAEYQRFIDDMPGTKHYNMTTRQRTAYANKLRQMAEKAKSTPPPVEKPHVVQLSQQGETVPTTRASITPSTTEPHPPTSESPANLASPNGKTPTSSEGPVPSGLTNPTTGATVANQSKLDKTIKYGRYSPEITRHLDVLTHEVHNQKMMDTAARRLIRDDPNLAHEVFSSGALKANPDAHAKLGENLILDAINKGGPEMQNTVNRLRAEYQSTLTTGGQTLRAARTNILTPRGIISYATKIADLQGKKLNRDQIGTLQEMAGKIEKMRDGPQKTELINAMKALAENKTFWTKSVDIGGAVVSLPRAIMASADLSFGLRQGAVLGSRMPKLWAEANAKGARFAVDPAFFKSEMGKLAHLTDKDGVPLAQLFKRMGLDLEAVHGRSEEIFGNVNLAESKAAKKLGVGHVIAGSDRAFSGTAAIMRAKAAKKIIDGYGGVEAVLENWTTKDFKDLGRVINTATGRGHGGEWFEKAAPTLGKTLFSARLWKSRLDLINPVYYARLSPAARKLALQSTASFGTLIGLTLSAAVAAGATVETDMRSADFGKIKIGNTRYDIMGGLQQNLVLAWREISGEKKNSTTGEISSLSNPKFGGDNRLSAIGRTIENKLAPVLAEALRQISGKTISGAPYKGLGDRLKDASGLAIPLNIQDTYSTGKDAMDNGASVPKAILKSTLGAAVPGTLGVGVQTYGPSSKDQIKAAQVQNNVDPTATADAIKAAMGGAYVNVNGKKTRWTDLSPQQQSTLARSDPTARGFYDQQEKIKKAMAPNKLYNPSLDPQSTKVLNYFDHLTTTGKTKVLQSEPGAAYALAQAKYNNDKLDGKFADPAKQAEADKSLAKAKVGSTYTQSLRDSYGMSKGDLQKLLGQGNNASMFNDLIAYDDALYNAGLIASHKFRNKYGDITLSIGSSGSGSSSSGGSSSSRRSSSRSSSAKPKAMPSPYKYKASVLAPKRANTATAASPGAKIAIRKPSRGKIKTSLIKNTT